MKLKEAIRLTLNFLRLDLTKNLEYDRLTKEIMKQVIGRDSNCIDVGCHKGEILDSILKFAPEGVHYAFEPIPNLYEKLVAKYNGKATILPFALSDKAGKSSFQYVKNAPAYSGIKKRKYGVEVPEIEEITVEMKPLDEVIPENVRIDFIKIDVEGGEFAVLKGAKKTIVNHSPIVIFESGIGASEYYGTKPETLFQFMAEELHMHIFTLKGYLKKGGHLSKEAFINVFETNSEYYFVAQAK